MASCCRTPRRWPGCAPTAPGPAAASTTPNAPSTAVFLSSEKHLQRLYSGLEGGHVDPGLTIEKMEDATLSVIEANLDQHQPGDEFVVG